MRRILVACMVLAVAIGLAVPAWAYISGQWVGTAGMDRKVHAHQYDTWAGNSKGGNDYLEGGDAKDVLYGGDGNDTIYGRANGTYGTDDLFGGDFCRETGYYFFEERAADKGWPDPSTLDCNVGDGTDYIYAGQGNDWLWESNSDNYGDGHWDYLDGGAGYDICIGETGDGFGDTVVNCEEVRRVPTNPNL